MYPPEPTTKPQGELKEAAAPGLSAQPALPEPARVVKKQPSGEGVGEGGAEMLGVGVAVGEVPTLPLGLGGACEGDSAQVMRRTLQASATYNAPLGAETTALGEDRAALTRGPCV